MNKNIILTLLMAMATVSAWAGDAVLIIKTKTAEYKYLYSQTPHIVPEGQTLTITCGNEAPVTLTFDEVEGITTPDVTGINQTEMAQRPQIQVNGGILNIADATESINVYDMAGAKVASHKAGQAQIALPQHGTYVVRIGKASFKVLVR